MNLMSELGRMFWKIIAVCILLLLNIGLLVFNIENTVETLNEEDLSYTNLSIQQAIAEGDYEDAYDRIILYDLDRETYPDYWCVIDAYHYYCNYTAASRAASHTTGETSETYQKMAEGSKALLESFQPDTTDGTALAAVEQIKGLLR